MNLSARNIAKDKITVLDSGTVSMALGWQALAGAEVAASGGSLDDVKAAIENTRRRIKLYAALDTLEYVRRGGRVGWISASVGSLLKIKPIVSLLDGEVTDIARVRTFKKAVQKIVELTHEQAPLERLAILHSNAPERAEQLKALLQDIAPKDYTVIADVNPALGTHVGPGAIGVATVQKE